jgi:threonine dehydratase
VKTEITVDGIRDAASVIDPAFLNSPQFECEPLSARLGVSTLLKVETVNPIRSFKGRGADYLLHLLGADARPIVCASAGNFGQGMAYACRKRGVRITVFASDRANPLKLERMQALGAKIELEAGDFDDAKAAARRHAGEQGELFIEDGLIGAIGEGAGTIGSELSAAGPLDAVFVPLGNGSLLNGVATWFKHESPRTQVIGVCAQASPSMAVSFRERRPMAVDSMSVADGIAVRVPVPEAVQIMTSTVKVVLLVSDDDMLTWMRHAFREAGLLVEPSGAAGLAAIAQMARGMHDKRGATILTGGNLTEEQIRAWLY